MSQAEEIRSAFLGDDEIDRCIVEHKGHKVEVRPPSVAQQRFFSRATKDKKTGESDGAKMLVLAAIHCCYVPGTEDKVFKPEDEEVLMNKSTHPKGILGKVTKELSKMMKESSAEIEESFDEAP